MTLEELIKAVLNASPAKRRKLEAVLNGTENHNADKTDDVRLVTITKAAELVGVSRNTIYDLMHTGRLDVVDVCGAQRITMQSIVEFSRGERPTNESYNKLREERHAKSAARSAERKAAKMKGVKHTK